MISVGGAGVGSPFRAAEARHDGAAAAPPGRAPDCVRPPPEEPPRESVGSLMISFRLFHLTPDVPGLSDNGAK